MVFPVHTEGFNTDYPCSLHKHMKITWTLQITFTPRITEAGYPWRCLPVKSLQEDAVTLTESTKNSDKVSFESNGVSFGKIFPQGRPGAVYIF